jgi:hypothetical protein
MPTPEPASNDPFAARYPHIARWVTEFGWVAIGDDEMSDSFIRALDIGGMVWSGGSPERPLSENLAELNAALRAYLRDQFGVT